MLGMVLVSSSCGINGPISTLPISNPGGPYFGNVNQALSFDGSGSSAPGGKSLVSFVWNFGDGGSASGAKPSHTYTVAGNYTATLTVTDNSGAMATSSVAVLIVTAPVAKPGGPYTGKVGVAISFDGSASTAPPGQSLGFSWNFGDGTTATGAKPSHAYGSANVFTVTLTVTDDTAGISIGTTTATITAGPEPGGSSATSAAFFALGPAINDSTQFAYLVTVSRSGISTLAIKTVDPAGNLHAAEIAAPSLEGWSDIAGMVSDPARRFLYLYTASGVESFLINPDDGSLTHAGGFSIASVGNIAGNQSFLFEPSGNYAYFVTQSEDGSAIVTRCSANPSGGGFTVPQETTIAQVHRPTSAVISGSGKFLYVAGKDSAGSPQLDGFSIDAESGVLRQLFGPSLSIQLRNSIVAMASATNGKFIYAVGNSIASNTAVLLTYSVNSATGTLEAPSNSSLNLNVAQGTTISISPSGTAAYISTITPLDETSAQQFLQMFSLDAQTGAPILLGTVASGILPVDSAAARVSSPVFSLPGATGPANLYLVNPADGTVSVFTANPITGQLTMHAVPANSSGN